MQKERLFLPSYFFFIGVLLSWLSLSPIALNQLNAAAVRTISPVLSSVDTLKGYITDRNRRSKKEPVASREALHSGVLARVIYRDPSSWSSTLWVDQGKQHSLLIAENSPVVQGEHVIGVVEYVSEKQSRIRLITDVNVCPAVRVLRGGEQERDLLDLLDTLYQRLSLRKEIKGCKAVLHELQKFKEGLDPKAETLYLAKGVLHGSSFPLWRCRAQVLKGIGFNYDYPDESGPSTSLLRGSLQVVEIGDLLVTSGLDGVFPPGLKVAIVSSVSALNEGKTSYEIEAIPTARHLNDLEVVEILPPLE